jgi:hypothetical protein
MMSGENTYRKPMSLVEQGVVARQLFTYELERRQEKRAQELLRQLAPTVSKEYSWMQTTNREEQIELAQALLEVKQHQDTAFIETGQYPEGPTTYRALQYKYRQEAGSKAILLAEALMGGDVREGTLPILSQQ